MSLCRSGLWITLTGFLVGCAEPEYIYVVPDVPATLRQPVSVPDRPVATLADVGVILADHVEGLGIANGRIVAFDCILTAAEAGETPDC